MTSLLKTKTKKIHKYNYKIYKTNVNWSIKWYKRVDFLWKCMQDVVNIRTCVSIASVQKTDFEPWVFNIKTTLITHPIYYQGILFSPPYQASICTLGWKNNFCGVRLLSSTENLMLLLPLGRSYTKTSVGWRDNCAFCSSQCNLQGRGMEAGILPTSWWVKKITQTLSRSKLFDNRKEMVELCHFQQKKSRNGKN